MQQKNKQTLALIAIIVLLVQTVFSSLPVMATSTTSILQVMMTTDGKPYVEGDIATSPVAIQVTSTYADSATVEFSQDGQTWQPFDVAKLFMVEDIGEHFLWFRLMGSSEIQKYTIRIAQPMLQTMANGLNEVTHLPEADVMTFEGSIGGSWDGMYNNYQNGKLYVGMTHQAPDLLNTKSRGAFRFKLDAGKEVTAATLELYVQDVEGVNPGYPLYVDVYGSPNNDFPNADRPLNSFPLVETGASSVRYIAPTDLSGLPVVPPGGKITKDVTEMVKAYTNNTDRDITLVAIGNESNPLNGRFSIYSAEHTNAILRPKLIVTYADNQPPTGTILVKEGAYTNEASVTLAITASDPDAGDIVTAMRFTENLANWPSVWENFTTSKWFPLSPGDGNKTIYMQLKDNRGGISAIESTSVFMDTSAPTGTLQINGGALWTASTNVNLSLTASDSGSGLKEMRFSNDSLSWGAWQAFNSLASWNIANQEGENTVYVQFKDAAGNISSGTISDTICLDKTSPSGTIMIKGGASITASANVNLALTANDSGSGVTLMRLRNENQPAGMGTWENYTTSKGWTLSGGEGTKTVYVEYRDAAGNVSTAVSASIVLDTTPPQVVGVTNGGLYNERVAFIFNEGTATLNGAPITSPYMVTDEGDYTLIVTDGAGNTTTVSFKVDWTPPEGELTINNGNQWTNNVNVTLMLSGLSPDTHQLQISNDPVGFDDHSGWLPKATTIGWALTPGDGEKTVYVRFKDQAGNISNIVSDSIKLLTAIPAGAVTINNGATWATRTAVELSFDNLSDGIAEFQVSNLNGDWSNAVWTPIAPVYNWNLSTGDGDKTIYVRFRDKAGNIGNEISAAIKLDTEVPMGNFTINDGDEWVTDKNVTLKFTGVSADVVAMQVSNEADTWSSAWENITSTYNWNVESGDGVKTVYVRFKDEAGNISNVVSQTIKLDTEAPIGTVVINDGNEWTMDTDVTLSITNVSPDAEAMQISNKADTWPSIWENIEPTYNWNLETGDGTKTVYVRFRDESGNISNAIIATIKLDTEAPIGTVVINNGNEWTMDTDVTLSITDVSPDAEAMQISNEAGTWSSIWENITSTYNWNLESGDGVKTVYVRFKDEAGNISNVISQTIKLDTEAPTGSFTINNGDELTKDKNVTLSFVGVSADAEAMQVSNEANTWSSAWENITSTYRWNLTTGNGMKTVYVRFRDEAGNISTAVSATIKFDATPSTGGNTTSPSTSNDNDDSAPAPVKITLHTNGGTVLAPIELAYNTKISDLPIPTRGGYRFDGWYEDEALTKPWAADTVVRENISLYAKWTALPVEESESPQEPQPSKPTVTFGDVETHWAKEMIEELAAQGIIQGYEDGTFRPNESVSRMHVAVLLTRAFSLEAVREADDFLDVPKNHRYYEAIKVLQQAGIIDGSNGAFLPAENMTRAQLAKVLVGILGLTPDGTSSFTDVDKKHWSAGYIAVLEREGIALGDNGNFRPNEAVTRAQFVAFLYRIMQR
ncbi:S-layer homology domain-containing protein [Bacillus ndiopicus]|uniref:S-layer homology domain-containing protein n=1 Tax=Bacillus ndiopicus TaxID=1347368 RepID=UPI000A83FCF4|nr:S-layer homology domain-containing protein [Bacillus ndiopicus]